MKEFKANKRSNEIFAKKKEDAKDLSVEVHERLFKNKNYTSITSKDKKVNDE
jgi:hypothetical protein